MPKKNNLDCGYAVITCLGGGYNQIKEKFPQNSQGTSIRGMGLMLEYISIKASLFYSKTNRVKLRTYKNKRGVFLIRSPKQNYGHWIILDKFQNVYDTETVEIVELKDYDLKENLVIAWYEF